MHDILEPACLLDQEGCQPLAIGHFCGSILKQNKEKEAQVEYFWILGAGRFGSIAVERITKKQKNSRLIVVDHDARALRKLAAEQVRVEEQDAIDFLLEMTGTGSEWVIPAIPQHVAFAWLCRQLAREGRVFPLPVPLIVDQQVPNPFRGEMGQLYSSLATFRCPDDCDEPPERCTVTGKRREANLFDVLGRLKVPGYVTRVVRSHQLAPGVGGYRLSVLWRLFEEAQLSNKAMLVATACNCHGVVQALRWNRSLQSAENGR